jgi:hypothetical protein
VHCIAGGLAPEAFRHGCSKRVAVEPSIAFGLDLRRLPQPWRE